MAALFDASPDEGLAWRDVIWPGEKLLVVTGGSGERRLQNKTWGLARQCFAGAAPLARRATLFPRDLIGGSRLASVEQLLPCLIVMEAFAYPDGPAGRRTRAWAGLWDHPLCAWAGLWSEDGVAGMLGLSHDPIARVSGHMPLVLTGPDQQSWLEGMSPLALSGSYPDAAFYLERTDELWSTGTFVGE
ncbi:MAG: hypothetical protein ABIV36_09695 [Sphingobium limneticum]